MFKVIQWDLGIPYPINKKGRPDKYTSPKLFKTREEAQAWIDKHSYKGMSWKYEIEEVT